MGGYDTENRTSTRCATGLSIPPDMRARLFDSLSGGEKTRVNLGRLILEDTDILLLDEPTNHLDLHATEWLEEYLAIVQGHRRWPSPTTAISSTAPCSRVIEILDGKAEFYSGNYSFYAVEKERRYRGAHAAV